MSRSISVWSPELDIEDMLWHCQVEVHGYYIPGLKEYPLITGRMTDPPEMEDIEIKHVYLVREEAKKESIRIDILSLLKDNQIENIKEKILNDKDS